jgi:hypothetical protein
MQRVIHTLWQTCWSIENSGEPVPAEEYVRGVPKNFRLIWKKSCRINIPRGNLSVILLKNITFKGTVA